MHQIVADKQAGTANFLPSKNYMKRVDLSCVDAK